MAKKCAFFSKTRLFFIKLSRFFLKILDDLLVLGGVSILIWRTFLINATLAWYIIGVMMVVLGLWLAGFSLPKKGGKES